MPAQTEVLWRQLPGVRMQERPRFLFFAGLATLISLAQTMGLVGSEALFLAHYGAAKLPQTFVAAALVTVFGSMIYAARVGVARNDSLFVQMLAGASVALGSMASHAGCRWPRKPTWASTRARTTTARPSRWCRRARSTDSRP